MRTPFRKLLDLIESIVFYMLATIAMHEGFHFLTAYLLGYEAYIKLVVHWMVWTGGVTYIVMPPSAPLIHRAFISLAGGLFTGIMLLWAWLFESDAEDRLVLVILWVEQMVYAVGECLRLFLPLDLSYVSLLGYVAGVCVSLLTGDLERFILGEPNTRQGI